DLAGRTAYVSGAGRNIGRAIAVALARLGANVVVNGRADRALAEATAEAVRGEGVEALVVMGDVARAEVIEAIAAEAVGRFGRVDIVVNNAAIRPHKPFLETTDADWSGVLDTALTGSFRTCRAFLPGMVEGGWGRIVNFAGMKAIRGYFEGAPISAAKHGVVGLTRALSTEFAPHGITANTVSPGQIAKDGGDPHDPTRIATVPAGHLGAPEDIAATVAHLAGPGGRFITGQTIAINGGEAT
ncbi:MAG: SDR family oxidoreductase, partial [Pseudomonadota bacterium]